jgi:hypothetical protein
MDRLPNKCAEESATKPEQYLQEVCDLIDSLRSILTEAEVAEVEHLVDHDEPVEGLRALAWIIHDEKKNVTANSVTSILRLIGDAVSKTCFNKPGF